MMRPDELRAKVGALESLERAVSALQKAEAIASGQLYYNGHQGTKFSDDELTVVRTALIDHHRTAVLIMANELRSAGIDPSSLLGSGK